MHEPSPQSTNVDVEGVEKGSKKGSVARSDCEGVKAA